MGYGLGRVEKVGVTVVRYMFLLAAFVLAAPAYAIGDDTGSGQVVAEATSAGTAEDKMVCKGKRQPRTGSNMKPGRECRLESEWKEREVFAKRELQRLREKQQSPGLGLGR